MSDVPVPPLDPDNARAALMAACRTVGIDAGGAELIRLGENAVFRLRAVPVVARVGRSLVRLPDTEREIAVARWLEAEAVPAIRPLDVAQPVPADGRPVTLWESASDAEDYGSTAELGTLLRQLHRLDAPPGLDLPPVEPFSRALRRIDEVPGIAEDDRAFLRSRGADLAEQHAGLSYELPPGVVHGDANVGNVLRDRHGQARLMDLDGFATGPREWDLILTAIYYDRFGWHTEDEYAAFVRAYGHNVLAWSGYPVLRDVREFLMVTWLMQNVADNPKAAAEFAKRMHTLRMDDSPRDWSPF